MLEEINHFLQEFPSTWMKLIQVVPLLEWTPPCSVITVGVDGVENW